MQKHKLKKKKKDRKHTAHRSSSILACNHNKRAAAALALRHLEEACVSLFIAV